MLIYVIGFYSVTDFLLFLDEMAFNYSSLFVFHVFMNLVPMFGITINKHCL